MKFVMFKKSGISNVVEKSEGELYELCKINQYDIVLYMNNKESKGEYIFKFMNDMFFIYEKEMSDEMKECVKVVEKSEGELYVWRMEMR